MRETRQRPGDPVLLAGPTGPNTAVKPLEVELVTDDAGFAALEGEWGELYAAAPAATPFQSWEWLYSWWEHYGEDRELRIVTVRDGDLLVGLLPLSLERRLGLPGRLLFAGTGPTDYLDLLAREGWEEAVAEASLAAMSGMGGWSVADLQEMRPSAAAWGLFDLWDGPRTAVLQSGCPSLAVRPWEEVLGALSKSHRNSIRRAIKTARKDGVRTSFVDGADLEAAAARLVGLHRERWRGRGISGEHLTGRFEGMVVSAARRLSRAGLGGVYESRRGGEVLASCFVLFGKDSVGGYLEGFTDEARSRYQVSALGAHKEIETALEFGLGRLDMLRGEEPYKLRWKPEVTPNHRLILGRSLPVWGAYAGYHVLRGRARQHARSRKVQRWLGRAHRRLREIGGE